MRRVAPLAALLVVAAGCGHDQCDRVPPGAIAVVGDRPVPRSALDAQIAQSRRAYAARGQAFPKPGTEAYRRLEDNAVRLLVDRTRLDLAAQKLGIVISVPPRSTPGSAGSSERRSGAARPATAPGSARSA